MGIREIFTGKRRSATESNSVFGQQALGNQVVLQSGAKSASQITYVTTGSATSAGRPVDVSMLTRNNTVIACVAVKARALSQLPIRVMHMADDGSFHDATTSN